MAEGILLTIRAHPSYPCQSVFYSDSPRRSPPARARRCACGLKPSLSTWKPLRAIVRFRHQDAQTPPSPRVGEGGGGMRGKRRGNAAHRALLPRTPPLRGEYSPSSVRIRHSGADPWSIPALKGKAKPACAGQTGFIAVLTKVEPVGQGRTTSGVAPPQGDRNEFRSTLC